MYDAVGGLLLRELKDQFTLDRLYMYPPAYPIEDRGPPVHRFIMWLSNREGGRVTDDQIASEYERLRGRMSRLPFVAGEVEPAAPIPI